MSFKGYGRSQNAVKVWRRPSGWTGVGQSWRQTPASLGLTAYSSSSMGSVPPTGIQSGQWTFKKDVNRWVTWEFRLSGDGFTGNSGALNIIPVGFRPPSTVSQQFSFMWSYGGGGHLNTQVTFWVDVDALGRATWRGFSQALQDVWAASGIMRWRVAA